MGGVACGFANGRWIDGGSLGAAGPSVATSSVGGRCCFAFDGRFVGGSCCVEADSSSSAAGSTGEVASGACSAVGCVSCWAGCVGSVGANATGFPVCAGCLVDTPTRFVAGAGCVAGAAAVSVGGPVVAVMVFLKACSDTFCCASSAFWPSVLAMTGPASDASGTHRTVRVAAGPAAVPPSAASSTAAGFFSTRNLSRVALLYT
mmetsp:Transcript_76521/g.211367  ORF Transcript_76521/g.211367 Transcript_76521/m.211367 type:complete len:204 (+) Transcript_76521:1002-1613(+)